MKFDPRRIADPEFFAENRRSAHSDHRWFADAAQAATGRSSFEESLNGTWKFHYAARPADAIAGFESPAYDCSGWADIPVPAHIQLQGHDRPQYSNVQYPWDGWEAVEPGQVPKYFNPVASYVTGFTLDRPLAAGERLSVCFNGAESALAVWLNGSYIGYATDSFTPSEFDLTDALVAGENKLAAQVFRFSSGSWLEDQDFFRFSGIFRDVVLYRRPAVHAEDLRITTEVAPDLGSAVVSLQVSLIGEGCVRAGLAGVGELADAGDGRLTIQVPQPRLWSAEDPHCYDLTIKVFDPEGALVEVVPQRVGVRRFGIEDGLLKINGQRLVFLGVNRHEFGLQGRVISREQTETDLKLLKKLGVNAIRTSHYPNQSFFYELCDHYGFYVVDEMNLETHGSWDAHRQGGASLADVIPGDRPEWRAALLDRAASMYERDKNHHCVVMWSCGNESFGGSNLFEVSQWLRAQDTRPIHYEGVFWDDRYPGTTDVASQMYTPAAEVERWLAEHRTKPFLLCEYAHAMGNSFGAVDAYLDLADREPLFQGGFIWDFADQALPLTDRHGREFFGYGGDFGDAPNDAEFSANGIFLADRGSTPKLQEVAYLYRPLHATISADSVLVDNRLLFTDSSAYECVVTLGREGVALRQAAIETAVPPGAQVQYPLPFGPPDEPGEYTVDVSFRQRTDTAWAPSGAEVAWDQGVFKVAGEPVPQAPGRPLEVVEGIHNVGVRGDGFAVLFSQLYGGLASYRLRPEVDGGRELLQGSPRPNFWHAPTANERGWGAPFDDGQWLLASRYAKPKHAWELHLERRGDAVEVGFGYLLPTVPASECEVVYLVQPDGRIEVTLTVRPGAGLSDMPEFGMLLATSADFDQLTWYGEGPEECYVDRRKGARLGLYRADVGEQLTPYVRPQEAGSHTGVRWASVTDATGTGLRFDCRDGMEFSALPWTPFEIENALHPNELPPIQRTVLRPALMRRGVGGDDSWGAETHPEYRLPRDRELVFRFGFQGIG